MNASKVARGLRDRIGRFSGDVSEGLGVVAQRFVAEMIYGIQASESVLLTEVGRTLAEPIALKKTQERLSRNLQRPELKEVVQDNVTRMLPLVLAVMYFAACVLDHDARLRLMAQYVERAAKRLFGIPDFKYYALADGLRSLFARHPGAPRTRIRAPENTQLPLFT